MIRLLVFSLMLSVGFSACRKDDDDDEGTTLTGTDISDATFTRTDGTCASYVGDSGATVTDVTRNITFISDIKITASGSTCTFTSNSIPNHNFNDGTASFATNVGEVTETFNMTSSPAAASAATALSLTYDNAIFLNGVKLDLLPAACYGVGGGTLGQEKIGCSTEGKPWRYDPMYSGNSFGTDAHNAHTQPDGAYHYHGSPEAMFNTSGSVASPVIGFAADGFPIFGPFIDDNGTVRRVTSGYTLKSGSRVSQSGEGAFPGGSYDGTFRDDYEYTGAGDLDVCNGMTRNGVYGYYVTNSFPWVMACFTGAPDRSFSKI